jgi:HD-like signal output (HDOD) protein
LSVGINDMNERIMIAASTLETLALLRELDQEALASLARSASYEDVPARGVVFRQGEQDPWVRYLVSGAMLLTGGGAADRTLMGMGDVAIADEPLGLEQPHPFTGIARTECRLIRLPSALLQELLASMRLPEIEVAEVDSAQGDASDRLFFQLVQDLMEERLELPSMPDIAVRVREAIAHPDTGAADVAKIIQADPVVATQVIKAANSSLFAGNRPADNLAAAVTRLGLKNTREIVMAVTMRQVFRSKNPLLNKRMVELWMHSTLVAAIAAVLARRLRGFSPDRALLAGLVHDIGVVPMLAHAHEYDELARDPGLLEATIAEYRGQIGAMILRRWNFPDDMIALALEAKDWQREHAGTADYGDLIIIAQLHGAAGIGGLPAPIDVPAFGTLGLDQVGAEGYSILDEAREEVADVQRLLLG